MMSYLNNTHVHQQYLKQPPKTSQGYPHLQVGIQVPLGHFGFMLNTSTLKMIKEGKLELIM